MNFSSTVSIKSIVFSALLYAGAFFAVAPAYAQPEPTSQRDGLVEVKSKVDLAYVRPGVDWSKYKTIKLYPLNVTPAAKDATPQGASNRNSRGESWLIPEKDIRLIKDEFDRIMRNELEKKEAFAVVKNTAADTLVVIPELREIYLTAPIESSRRTQSSRGGTYSETSGSMTIAVLLADGETGNVVAQAVDERHSTKMWRENNRVRNLSDMRRVFGAWGKQLRSRLQDFAEGKGPYTKN